MLDSLIVSQIERAKELWARIFRGLEEMPTTVKQLDRLIDPHSDNYLEFRAHLSN